VVDNKDVVGEDDREGRKGGQEGNGYQEATRKGC
jgi:hypothetical protein